MKKLRVYNLDNTFAGYTFLRDKARDKGCFNTNTLLLYDEHNNIIGKTNTNMKLETPPTPHPSPETVVKKVTNEYYYRFAIEHCKANTCYIYLKNDITCNDPVTFENSGNITKRIIIAADPSDTTYTTKKLILNNQHEFNGLKHIEYNNIHLYADNSFEFTSCKSYDSGNEGHCSFQEHIDAHEYTSMILNKSIFSLNINKLTDNTILQVFDLSLIDSSFVLDCSLTSEEETLLASKWPASIDICGIDASNSYISIRTSAWKQNIDNPTILNITNNSILEFLKGGVPSFNKIFGANQYDPDTQLKIENSTLIIDSSLTYDLSNNYCNSKVDPAPGIDKNDWCQIRPNIGVWSQNRHFSIKHSNIIWRNNYFPLTIDICNIRKFDNSNTFIIDNNDGSLKGDYAGGGMLVSQSISESDTNKFFNNNSFTFTNNTGDWAGGLYAKYYTSNKDHSFNNNNSNNIPDISNVWSSKIPIFAKLLSSTPGDILQLFITNSGDAKTQLTEDISMTNDIFITPFQQKMMYEIDCSNYQLTFVGQGDGEPQKAIVELSYTIPDSSNNRVIIKFTGSLPPKDQHSASAAQLTFLSLELDKPPDSDYPDQDRWSNFTLYNNKLKPAAILVDTDVLSENASLYDAGNPKDDRDTRLYNYNTTTEFQFESIRINSLPRIHHPSLDENPFSNTYSILDFSNTTIDISGFILTQLYYPAHGTFKYEKVNLNSSNLHMHTSNNMYKNLLSKYMWDDWNRSLILDIRDLHLTNSNFTYDTSYNSDFSNIVPLLQFQNIRSDSSSTVRFNQDTSVAIVIITADRYQQFDVCMNYVIDPLNYTLDGGLSRLDPEDETFFHCSSGALHSSYYCNPVLINNTNLIGPAKRSDCSAINVRCPSACGIIESSHYIEHCVINNAPMILSPSWPRQCSTNLVSNIDPNITECSGVSEEAFCNGSFEITTDGGPRNCAYNTTPYPHCFAAAPCTYHA